MVTVEYLELYITYKPAPSLSCVLFSKITFEIVISAVCDICTLPVDVHSDIVAELLVQVAEGSRSRVRN